ncbi:MAG: hypothetical protein QNJ72_39325 [Pleurocapsa sp. MO_226.B13]|nr:hypothetical protein [Pleurocapsa sp. MO_226.B13]
MNSQTIMRVFKTLIFTTAILGSVTPAIATTYQIIKAEGQVLLKRRQWSDYRPTSEGAQINLNQDDFIYLDRGAKIIIQCPDKTTTWRVPSGRVWGASNGCPRALRRSRATGLVGGILGGTDPSVPYLISPRRTLILDRQPTFRWNAVPEASNYTISLSTSAEVIWQQKVSETEIVYPGEPLLGPGKLYSLTIKADTGTSSQDENVSGLEFVLLTDTDLKQVQTDVEQLTNLELSDEAETLALANFYADYILNSDSAPAYNLAAENLATYSLTAKAIEILEALVAQGSTIPAVYRILGDLYWESGLQLLAEVQYLKVVELAQEPKYLEERAKAQFSLAEMYVVLEKWEETDRWLRQAKQSYVELGDRDNATMIEEQLEELNQLKE